MVQAPGPNAINLYKAVSYENSQRASVFTPCKPSKVSNVCGQGQEPTLEWSMD
jgi:hypothetical protein